MRCWTAGTHVPRRIMPFAPDLNVSLRLRAMRRGLPATRRVPPGDPRPEGGTPQRRRQPRRVAPALGKLKPQLSVLGSESQNDAGGLIVHLAASVYVSDGRRPARRDAYSDSNLTMRVPPGLGGFCMLKAP